MLFYIPLALNLGTEIMHILNVLYLKHMTHSVGIKELVNIVRVTLRVRVTL
jgi:hypothetical protein